MVLKKLSDAISHGDTVRAIIRATGSNQDGHTPAIVQPSSDAQEQLIRSVYNKAGLDFKLTHYFEAHSKPGVLTRGFYPYINLYCRGRHSR
jgi:acyl transferase domain-containing protein